MELISLDQNCFSRSATHTIHKVLHPIFGHTGHIFPGYALVGIQPGLLNGENIRVHKIRCRCQYIDIFKNIMLKNTKTG
jgi:hypothetical protein